MLQLFTFSTLSGAGARGEPALRNASALSTGLVLPSPSHLLVPTHAPMPVPLLPAPTGTPGLVGFQDGLFSGAQLTPPRHIPVSHVFPSATRLLYGHRQNSSEAAQHKTPLLFLQRPQVRSRAAQPPQAQQGVPVLGHPNSSPVPACRQRHQQVQWSHPNVSAVAQPSCLQGRWEVSRSAERHCQLSCVGMLARTHRYLCWSVGVVDLDTTAACGNLSNNSGAGKRQGLAACWMFWRESKFNLHELYHASELWTGG